MIEFNAGEWIGANEPVFGTPGEHSRGDRRGPSRGCFPAGDARSPARPRFFVDRSPARCNISDSARRVRFRHRFRDFPAENWSNVPIEVRRIDFPSARALGEFRGGSIRQVAIGASLAAFFAALGSSPFPARRRASAAAALASSGVNGEP